jgi:hypothetical protein
MSPCSHAIAPLGSSDLCSWHIECLVECRDNSRDKTVTRLPDHARPCVQVGASLSAPRV